jgi:zinc protease
MLETEIQLPFLLGGFKVPPDSSADAPVLEVISNLLSNGQSSRLYRKLVYEDQSALFAGGLFVPRKDVGLFYAYAAVKPGQNRDSLEQTFFHEVERLASEPVVDVELTKVKTQLEAQFVFSLEAVQDRARAVGNAALLTGDPAAAARRIDRLRAVSAEDIRRVAAKYLVGSNRTVVWVVPTARSAS